METILTAFKYCLQCGHTFASGHTYHWAQVGFGGGVAPNDVCQVPPGKRVENFRSQEDTGSLDNLELNPATGSSR
jgi:hypothetical protein